MKYQNSICFIVGLFGAVILSGCGGDSGGSSGDPGPGATGITQGGAQDPHSYRQCRHCRTANGCLPSFLARWLAAHRPDLAAGVRSRSRTRSTVSRRRSREVSSVASRESFTRGANLYGSRRDAWPLPDGHSSGSPHNHSRRWPMGVPGSRSARFRSNGPSGASSCKRAGWKLA